MIERSTPLGTEEAWAELEPARGLLRQLSTIKRAQCEEIIMSRQLMFLPAIALIAVAGVLRPNPAAAMQVSHRYGPGPIALNPQPLPPGFRINPGPRLFPHCHGVQIGDPRTHPPVRVCN